VLIFGFHGNSKFIYVGCRTSEILGKSWLSSRDFRLAASSIRSHVPANVHFFFSFISSFLSPVGPTFQPTFSSIFFFFFHFFFSCELAFFLHSQLHFPIYLQFHPKDHHFLSITCKNTKTPKLTKNIRK
jgi:hypothetical protein